jgi:hypothetical protein
MTDFSPKILIKKQQFSSKEHDIPINPWISAARHGIFPWPWQAWARRAEAMVIPPLMDQVIENLHD